jgi:methylmalonyl-CoA mutase
MQEVEQAGGFRKARESGMIAQRLETARIAKEQAVATRRSIFTGTNRFANPAEVALSRVDEARMNAAPRGAQAYEQLRLRTERHADSGGKSPRILLAEIGDPRMCSARSQFAADIFACVGLATVTQKFSNTPEIAGQNADLIVLCSSDSEYLAHASALFTALVQTGRETPVVIAGNPETAEELRALGVTDFVHLRSNPVEFLARWQHRLGIED